MYIVGLKKECTKAARQLLWVIYEPAAHALWTPILLGSDWSKRWDAVTSGKWRVHRVTTLCNTQMSTYSQTVEFYLQSLGNDKSEGPGWEESPPWHHSALSFIPSVSFVDSVPGYRVPITRCPLFDTPTKSVFNRCVFHWETNRLLMSWWAE